MTWTARHRALAALLVAGGVLLRLLADVRRPLFIDEAAIALNLNARSALDLLAPLGQAQVAPPGFLLIEKAMTTMFGTGEVALRAFPLAAGIAAVLLFARLVQRVLDPIAGLCALALVAMSGPLIDYSPVAKPYASDVAAAVIVPLLASADVSGRGRRGIWSRGVAGAVLACCSFTSVFVLAGAAAASLWRAAIERQTETRRLQMMSAIVWMACAAVGVVVGRLVLSPTDALYMQWFWMPGFPPSDTAIAPWLWRGTVGLFGRTAGYRLPTLWVVVTFVGVWGVWRRRGFDRVLLMGGPAVALVAAAVLRLYPFEPGRLQYFLLPSLFILASEGAVVLGSVSQRRIGWSAVVPALVLVCGGGIALVTRQHAFASVDDVRGFVETVASRRQPGDAIYLTDLDGLTFLYYAPRAGLTSSDYLIGQCAQGRARSYLREIDALQGHARVWIGLTHQRDAHGDIVRGYLDAKGARRDAMDGVGYGYLYDLSLDSGHSVSADRYPVPPEYDLAQPYRWNCYGVFDIPRDETARPSGTTR